MIGKTLGGYRIIEQIGLGGMATVYKAYDPGTDRYVAVKVLPQQYAQDTEFQARFQQEAKAIAHLEHLHILPVFAFGEQDGTTFMVMRYMDAGTLGDVIKRKQLTFEEITRFLSQLASALDYAHDNGIVHRDVKPSNVLVDRQGNVFLTDFGIAKILEGGMKLTGTGSVIGTPQYMAPEQLEPGSEVSRASDQYALGVILYEMATGQTPYQAVTPWAIIAMHQRREPMALPRALNPNLPEAAEQVILKALAHEPGQRFESCSALAAAFQQAVQDAPTRVAAPTRASQPAPQNTVEAATAKGLINDSAPLPNVATQMLQRKSASPLRWGVSIGALLIVGIVMAFVLSSINSANAPTVGAEATTVATSPNTTTVTEDAATTEVSQAAAVNSAAVVTIDGAADEWANIPKFEDVRDDSTGALDITAVQAFADDQYLYLLIEGSGGDWNDIYSLQVEIDTNLDRTADYRLVTIRDRVLMGPNDAVSPEEETQTEVSMQPATFEARIPLAEMELSAGQTLQLLVVYYFETANPNVGESDAVPNVPQGIPVSYLPSA